MRRQKEFTEPVKQTIYVSTGESNEELQKSISDLSDRVDEIESNVNSTNDRLESKKRGMTEKEWEAWKEKH